LLDTHFIHSAVLIDDELKAIRWSGQAGATLYMRPLACKQPGSAVRPDANLTQGAHDPVKGLLWRCLERAFDPEWTQAPIMVWQASGPTEQWRSTAGGR
jgi:hypothetical protein